MGIVYNTRIRFIKVKSVADVDESIDYYKEAYLEKAKRNLTKIILQKDFGTGDKGSLRVYNFRLIDEPDVICFSNSACDNYDIHNYKIRFYYPDNSVTTIKRDTLYPLNRFMVICPIFQDKPLSIDFYAGPGKRGGNITRCSPSTHPYHQVEDYESDRETTFQRAYQKFLIARETETESETETETKT